MNITLDYTPKIYSLKIGSVESPFDIYIIRTNTENLDTLEIESIEKTTGIRFTSSDAIPIDSNIVVENVTE